MLAELPVTVRLVRVEARQQERAVLPEDAWVVLITLNKDRTQQIKWANIARESVVLLLDIIIQPLEDGVVIFLVALLREFARPEHVAVRQSFEMALIRLIQLRQMGQHLHTVTGGIGHICGLHTEHDDLAVAVRLRCTGKIQGNERICRDIEQARRRAVVLHVRQLFQIAAARERSRAAHLQLMEIEVLRLFPGAIDTGCEQVALICRAAVEKAQPLTGKRLLCAPCLREAGVIERRGIGPASGRRQPGSVAALEQADLLPGIRFPQRLGQALPVRRRIGGEPLPEAIQLRILREKRLQKFLQILTFLHENAPSFSLICAGNGPQSPRGIFVSGSGPSVPCSGMVQ